MPSNARIGRYTLLEPLGQGGMGVVYRARNDDTGAIHALKTVRLPKRTMLASIRREIRALARIDHPGIVHIVEHGVHDGLPWYAMQLLSGRSLRHVMSQDTTPRDTPSAPETLADAKRWWTFSVGHHAPLDTIAAFTHDGTTTDAADDTEEGDDDTTEPGVPRAPQPPQDWREAVRIALHLCDALAYLHSTGIIHRDLKPENVILLRSRRPILMDFGLALEAHASFGRERVTDIIPAAGTIQYMAPEQLEGRWVDARADLYALGAILYELVTGHPPFAARSRMAMLLELRTRPTPPSEHVPDIPPALEATILRLLDPTPEERLGYAEDVAERLAPLIDDPPTLRTYPPHLYRPSLAGRAQQQQRVTRLLERTLQGQGAVVLIGGVSGIGKTRLALECIQHAHSLQLSVLTGTCSPFGHEGAAAALYPLRAAFASVIQDRSLSHCLDNRDARILAGHIPELADHPTILRQPEPEPLPASEALLRTYVSLTRILERIAHHQPALLVLDDLQWADPLTLGWLEYVSRLQLHNRCGLVILGTFRSDEGGNLQHILDLEAVTHVALERLDVTAVSEMVATMLALDEPPEAFIRDLHTRSRGNPFFIAEYLRTALSEGYLTRNALSRWSVRSQTELERLDVPSVLQDILHRRLARIRPQARSAADFAAVLGRELDPALLDDAQRDALDELYEREILELTPQGLLRFLHDKLREALYDELSDDTRRALHRLAAERTRALLEHHPELHAVCAYHHELAGDHHEAYHHAVQAAHAAEARYELADAATLLHTALRLNPGATAAIHLDLARVLFHSGKTHDALIRARDALQSSTRDPLHRARVLMLYAEIQSVLGLFDEARASLDEARAIATELDERAILGELLTRLGNLHRTRGELDAARDALERALTLLRASNERASEALAIGSLANVLFMQGAHQDALELYETALEIHHDEGHRREAAVVLTNIGNAYQHQGDHARARALHEQALDIYRQLGARRHEGTSLNNIALCHHADGRLHQARELLTEALDIHRETGDRNMEGLTLSNLAAVQHQLRELETARLHLEDALDIQREIGNRRSEAIVLSNLAVLRAECGLIAHARRAFAEADALLEREPGAEEQRLSTLLHRATFLRRTGDLDDAEAVLERLPDDLPSTPLRVSGLLQRALLHRARHQTTPAEITRTLQAISHPDAEDALDTLRRAEAAPETLGGEAKSDLPERLVEALFSPF